ncbi:alkaline phosphatase [Flammeovirgaceae bacterium SG7u.111]|nr:alkaline phosphatase [Flammeovirgaceae bacterium SG7u.132]WPO37071.1 alkaline phosphatase [Flammeovirgaceae bacterium SG7u.111]
MKTISHYLLLVAFFLGTTGFTNPSDEPKKAKYVFFFIGDGMGEAHVSLTEAYLAAAKGEVGTKLLTMSKFPTLGFQSTYSKKKFITDSAASGTALATGSKTSNGTIGMKEDHKTAVHSIAYSAKQAGLKVGILSSVSINHATPASFYAHQPSRGDYYKIGVQLPKSGFDVFGGGGFNHPTGKEPGSMPSAYEITEKAGYKYISTKPGFANLKSTEDKIMMVSPDILGQAEIPYSIDQKAGMLTLADFTKKAINLLDNPNGFFLMVEGGKIDWAAHANDAASVVQEVIDFDKAIKEAVDFYNEHPDETIIIITADHETGGLAMGNSKMKYESNFALLKKQKGSINELNNLFIDFIKENSLKELSFEKVLEIGKDFFGIDKSELDSEELQSLQIAHKHLINNEGTESLTYADSNAAANAWLKIFNTKAGIGWISHAHTGIPVPVRALGVQQSSFDGFYDNTDIPKKLAEIMDIKFIK